MSDSRAKLLLRAHAIRTATALALLLHARDRGARELPHPGRALFASLLVALVIVVVSVVGARIGMLLGQR